MVAGVSAAITSYEQYDNNVPLLGELNGAANSIWFLWLLSLGVVLIRRSPTTPQPSSPLRSLRIGHDNTPQHHIRGKQTGTVAAHRRMLDRRRRRPGWHMGPEPPASRSKIT